MIYSPSQTKSYLECPTKRMLNQEGWTERIVGIRDWTAWTGQGVHAGLAQLFNPINVLPGKTYSAGSIKAGQDEFRRQFHHAVSHGRIIPNMFYEGEALAHIDRCLSYVAEHDILPAGFEVERTEQTLGDYNCILDVVGKKNGKPTFIDWKVKNKCKLDYLDQELEKYRYDWKEARHYPWALSEVTGQRVEEYTVVIFVLGPQFRVVKRTYPVNWKVVERWHGGLVENGLHAALWSVMESGVWQSNACMGGQWPCEYLDACWTYDLDREKMKHGGLVQVARLNKEVKECQQ